ncbi:hypothetical protein Hanom_Chr11g00997381 [Helianthus anomalus]
MDLHFVSCLNFLLSSDCMSMLAGLRRSLVLLSDLLLNRHNVARYCLPKTFKCSKFGFLPFNASYGVLFTRAFVGTLFNTYIACRIASPQKFCGMFIAFNILRVVDNIVLFRLSTTPFCCGEYGAPM